MFQVTTDTWRSEQTADNTDTTYTTMIIVVISALFGIRDAVILFTDSFPIGNYTKRKDRSI